MEKTTNYKLYKPSYDDDVDIQILNNNMDILDDNLKRNNDKFKQYLPLGGGTMQGDIMLPNERAMRYDPNTCIKFIIQNELKTIRLEGERLSFNTPNDKHFKVDDSGVWFCNDQLIRDLYSSNDEFSGYTKLSTGLLMQWGFVNPSGSTYNVQHATFKTPMASSSYAVVTSRSFYTGNRPSNNENRWGSVTFNFTTTGFDICCAEPSAYGTAEFWIAIGRHK